MPKIVYVIGNFILCAACALVLFLSVNSKATAFSDAFLSDPRFNSEWDVQNDNGLIFDNPGITLGSLNSGSFPYLKTSIANDLSSDTYYEIDFQYLTTGSPWAVGFSLTDNAPNFPTYLGTISDYLNYNVAYLFGEKVHVVTALCPTDSLTCPNSWWFIYPNSPASTSYSPATPADYARHKLSITKTPIAVDEFVYEVFLDSNSIFTSKPTPRNVNAIWIGHPSDLGGSKNWPILKIYSVRSLPVAPVTFPYFSQKDPTWGSMEYDTASTWAPGAVGIERWGCALTSVAMVLKQYNVQMPDGTTMDPAVLNAWLASQPDGYVGEGLLNWLAVTRLVHTSKLAGKSPTELEFVKDDTGVDAQLTAGNYPILDTNGHFVVATGQNGSDWAIQDPNDETLTTLSPTPAPKSVNTYIPSSTNLSYMLMVADPSTILQLSDGLANVTMDTYTEYLRDDVGGGTTGAVKTYYLREPVNGIYNLTLTNPSGSTAEVEVLLYDRDGGVTKDELSVPGNTTATFGIDYSQTPGGGGEVELDYAPIFAYLKSLRIAKTAGNGIFQALYARVNELIGYLSDPTASTAYASDLSRFVTKQKYLNETQKTTIQNYIYLITSN